MTGKLPQKEARNKSGKYGLFSKFNGYHAREDQTTLQATFPEGTTGMVAPSQNVLIKTSGRVSLVQGYSLDGVGSTIADSGILSNYDFTSFTGATRNLRAGFITSNGNDGKLQYRYLDSLGNVNWINLLTGLSNVRLSYTSFYDSTNLVPNVKWVDGSSNIFSWNGAVTTFASASSATGFITVLNATPTSGGTGYVIGDILTITGGTATAKVTSVSSSNSGAVTGVNIDTYTSMNYVIGDVLTLSTGGTGGTLTVTSIGAGGSILSFVITTGGSGYSAGYSNVLGGSGTGALALITALGGQVVTGVSLITTSSGYSTGTGKATTGGTGTGATLNITTVANYSITKQGTDTLLQEGFQTTSGNITIGGLSYSYSLSIGQTFVGFSVDPTTPVFTVGSVIHQTPITTALSTLTGILATFSPTVIGTGRRNQLYLGSSSSNNLYISKVNSVSDFSFSSPSLDGDGAFWTLVSPPVAFIAQENRNDANEHDLYIAHGNSTWSECYFSTYTTADSTGIRSVTQVLNVNPLKTSYLQAPQSQKLVSKMKNHIVFVGQDNVANFFGYLSFQYIPEMVDFSYPIIDDMSGYDFTDGSIFYYKNYIYIAIPKKGLIRAYNMTDQTKQTTSSIRAMEDVDVSGQPWFWEAPILYPISGFYWTPDKGLCGHSYVSSESYQLFTGGDFNTQQIEANATFVFNEVGDRTQRKGDNELWVEGYISQNTVLNATVSHDLNTFQTQQVVTVNGNDNTIVAYGAGGHALGKNPLGSRSLGGADISSTLPAWFHVAKTFVEQPSFFLEQISFSTKGVDLDWEIIDYGTNATFTNEGINDITQ